MRTKPNKPGWTVHRFEDFVENVREQVMPTPEDSKDYIGLEHLDSGSLHVRRWGTEIQLKGTKFRMKKGDLLFARRNAYLRRVAVAPHHGLFSAHGMIFRPKPDIVSPNFLPFFLSADIFMDRAIKISVGSLSPTINWGTLRHEEFSLPPLDEQKRLANLSWSVDETIESYKNFLSALDIYKKGVLLDIGNKQESLREIGDVTDILDNLRKPLNSTQRSKMKGDIPYYGANGIVDMVNDYIFDDDLVLLAEDGGNFHDYLNRSIAYLISGKSWVNNHAHVLRPKKGLRVKWLFYSLVHKDITKYIVGTTRVKLNKGALSKIKIYVPDVSEQDKLIAKMDSIFKVEENLRIR